MKNVYVIHSSNDKHKNYLYSAFDMVGNHDINYILPHLGDFKNSYDIIKQADLIIVYGEELTFGMGIEIAWANSFNKHIIVLHRKDTKLSQSLSVIPYKSVVFRDKLDLQDILRNLK